MFRRSETPQAKTISRWSFVDQSKWERTAAICRTFRYRYEALERAHCSHSRVPDGSSAVGDGGLLITETSVFTKLQQPKDNCSGAACGRRPPRSSRRGRAARATAGAPRRCARGPRPPRAPTSCPGWPRPARRTRGRCWCWPSPTSPWTGCRARALSAIITCASRNKKCDT